MVCWHKSDCCLFEVNLATLTSWGYYQILNTGISLLNFMDILRLLWSCGKSGPHCWIYYHIYYICIIYILYIISIRSITPQHIKYNSKSLYVVQSQYFGSKLPSSGNKFWPSNKKGNNIGLRNIIRVK